MYFSFIALNASMVIKLKLFSDEFLKSYFQGLLVNWQKSFGMKLISSDNFHANVGIITMFCNGVKYFVVQQFNSHQNLCFQTSRIIWGLLFDRIGYKKCTITIGLCVAVGTCSFALLEFLGRVYFY